MPTPRQVAHAEAHARILEAGRRQLAEHGADGLSLRAVARDVGMVSSAVYRYVASRDDLLTALIIEAYDAVGSAVETAAAARTTPGRRFVRAAHAIRDWGRDHPHEYALLYGTPVPGYEAPESTIAPAARVPATLATLVAAAEAAGTLDPPAPSRIPRDLAGQLRSTVGQLGLNLSPAAMLALLHGWSAIYGFVSFELTGQLKGTFDPADAAAAYEFGAIARTVGFTDA
ncbi:TetR/AcrR family transcriptional regulator [Calidifontibacter sp. DB0510]|uniref:TetR/AcrR family transcriptional regulator n=1 Tax=Metallococcus carri TaxID=1656884 RepID=A0A967B3T0_9MICO|nr:TetR/AcrR family transcriptional regulator [Metallococcus carri]NHN56840.1 TetR/AcrR family transcriptional regulator [Metallococcus carri]NOP37783.1 TetR family transcriptional regulator [Calidifontibacter sp. DB2511S]